jgi:hypothetical protein
MSYSKTESSNWAKRNAKNTVRLGIWTGAWLVTTALLAFGPKLLWDFNTPLTVLAVLVNLAVGGGMILANKTYLGGLDEMQQKIFRDSAALTLGVGLVAAVSYEMLEDIRLISFEPEISHLLILMALTFLGAMIAGNRKYQ